MLVTLYYPKGLVGEIEIIYGDILLMVLGVNGMIVDCPNEENDIYEFYYLFIAGLDFEIFQRL